MNTEDNTPAVLHLRLVPGDQLSLTVAPKGAGSENMTSLHMLKPSASQQDVEDAIVQAVSDAGSNPCPPVVVAWAWGAMRSCAPCWPAGPAAAPGPAQHRPLLRRDGGPPAGAHQPAGHRPPGAGGYRHRPGRLHPPLRHPHRTAAVCVNLCATCAATPAAPVTGQQGTFVSQVFMNHKSVLYITYSTLFLSFSESIRPTGRLPLAIL